jgi:peroxiredoxin
LGNKIARLLAIVAVLVTLALITFGLLQPAQSRPASVTNSQVGLEKGQAAPNFSVSLLDGKQLSLSDLRGKVVMLNFWFIDCPACKEEIPDLQRFYAAQQQSRRDMVIVGINVLDNQANVSKFASQQHITYPLAVDSNHTIARLYSIRAEPTSYFLDRRGIIHEVIEGQVEQSQLQQITNKITS